MENLESEPASPCLRQCQLSERQICVNCGRTVDEISGWRAMTVEQKQTCIEAAAARVDLAADMMD